MSDVADYDADILLWSERQAAILRDLKTKTRELPNELDLENVAEEIESVGRSELAAVESFLVLVMVHALKAASVRKPSLVAKWRREASTFAADARRRITPAMLRRLNLDDAWADALDQAKLRLAEHEDEMLASLPLVCPLALDDLLGRPLEFDELVARIEASCVRPDGTVMS